MIHEEFLKRCIEQGIEAKADILKAISEVENTIGLEERHAVKKKHERLMLNHFHYMHSTLIQVCPTLSKIDWYSSGLSNAFGLVFSSILLTGYIDGKACSKELSKDKSQ